MREYIMETSDTGWVTKVKQEIVRCKDCMHYDGDEYSGLGTCLENGVCSKPDWFCADGERKDS